MARAAGDLETAAVLLLARLKESPEDPRAWNELGALLHAGGEYDRAVECFKRALHAGGHDPVLLENLVMACVSAGRHPEAALLASRWTRSDPDCARAWGLLGRLHLMAAQPAEARACLRRALELDPADPETNRAMGELGPSAAAEDAPAPPEPPLPFLPPLNDQAPPAVDDPAFVWLGAALGLSSYAIHSRLSIVWLRQAGLRVEAFPVGRSADAYLATLPAAELRELKAALTERVDGGVFVMHHAPATVSAPDVYLQYCWRRPRQLAYAALTAFETEGIPAHWVNPLNRMDEVWVQTEFNRRTFAEAGVRESKLRVVGAGLDMALYDPARIAPSPALRKRSFVFLSIFQWHSRKGWPILIEAFARTFSRADDVCLVIKALPVQGDPTPIEDQVTAHLAQRGISRDSAAPIIIIDRDMTDTEIRTLYRSADAFVLPTRGEGWGIPFHEAMAMGLPTIGTRYSGHLDYMNDTNSYLIDIRGLVEVDPAMLGFNPEYAGLRYAEPDMEHLAHLMRRVVDRREEAAAIGARARQDILARWSKQAYVARLRAAARALAGRAQSRRAVPPAPLAPRPDLPPLLLHGPMLDPSGYAHDFRNLALGLADLGADLRIDHQCWNHRYGLINVADTARIVGLMPPDAPPEDHVSIENPLVPPSAPRPGALRVMRAFWETDRFPADKAARCATCRQVWVASTCNAEALHRAGVPRDIIRIVPVALDVDRYGHHVEPLPLRDPHRFTFLACFDLSLRKGWDLLLRAFFQEFSPSDGVRLLLNIHSSSGVDRAALAEFAGQWARKLAGERWLDDQGRWRAHTPLHCIEQDLHEDDLPRFFRSGDAYAMPSRGEGWGIPAMQAMASGLPVIATAWGGQTDFIDSGTGWLLPYHMVPVSADACREVPAFAGHMWAEPELDALRHALRRVKDDPAEARRRAEAGRLRVRERYNRPAVAAIAARCLAELPRRSPPPPAPRPPRVLWQGPQLLRSSLAMVNRELCARLAERGRCRITLHPAESRPDPRVCRPAVRRRIESLLNTRRLPDSDVLVRHAWPPDFSRPDRAARLVLMQPWEFGRIPDPWVGPIRQNVDELWVYSRHVFESYLAAGLPAGKLWRVPLGVDHDLFRPDGPRATLSTRKSFKFLFVGGTIWRKGIDVLLAAYADAFTAADDVSLVIKDMGQNTFYKGQCATEHIHRFQARPGAPELLYLTDDMTEEQIAALYRACDCLVHPYRGEGFGLPVAEAAAAGLPVIVTRGGATDDFIPANAGYFIPARRVGVRLEEFNLDGWVLEPDRNALAELMRRVHARDTERRERSALLRNALKRLTWDAAAEAVELRLHALLNAAGSPS
jgi:glycosyltransferase involved in cell wall biosynthesis